MSSIRKVRKDYVTLVGESYTHIRGAPHRAAYALFDAIYNAKAGMDGEERHVRIAKAMATVARLWSPLSARRIPIFADANAHLEREGEPVTIDWS